MELTFYTQVWLSGVFMFVCFMYDCNPAFCFALLGDFRMNESMLSLPHLKDVTLHTLHLDTTYCDQRYVFPTQEEVIHFVVEKVKKAIATKPNTLVLCGSYTIGKERIFVGWFPYLVYLFVS